jgi:hypothetical protein
MDMYDLAVAIAAAARFADRLASIYPDPVQRETGEDGSPTADHFTMEVGAFSLDGLRCVLDNSWWTQAEPHAIGRAFAQARSMRQHSPWAGLVEDTIRFEVLTRYGIDVDRACGPPQLVRDQFERYEVERVRAVRRRSNTRP